MVRLTRHNILIKYMRNLVTVNTLRLKIKNSLEHIKIMSIPPG